MKSALPGRPTAFLRAMPFFVALAGMLVYANALNNGFVLDAEGIVLKNPLVHGIDGVWRAFANPYWPETGGQYRPLVISTFAAEWALWGSRAAGFHAVNIVLHGLSALLVYVFARRWLSFGGAAIAGFVFALHPVHVEAVANIVGRAELMAACSVIGMLLLHERRSPWAVAVFAAGMLSKEHAIVAPVLAALLDAARPVVQRRDSTRGREQAEPVAARRVAPIYIGYGVVVVLWAGAVAWLFRDRALAFVDPVWLSMDAPSRVLTMLGAVTTWVRLWFWPFELSADYSPQVTVLWPENQALMIQGAVLIAAALVLAALGWRRARHVSVALLWIAIAMAPVSNFLVPTGIIVAERTLLLSSVGAALLIGSAAQWCAQRRPGASIAVVVMICAAFAARVWTRTPVWETNRALFLETAESHPEASATHLLLARVYTRAADYDAALEEYRRSLRLFGANPVAWSEAIDVAWRSSRPAVADSLAVEARAQMRRLPPGLVRPPAVDSLIGILRGPGRD